MVSESERFPNPYPCMLAGIVEGGFCFHPTVENERQREESYTGRPTRWAIASPLPGDKVKGLSRHFSAGSGSFYKRRHFWRDRRKAHRRVQAQA